MSLSMSSLPKVPSSTSFFAKISTNLPGSLPSSISNYQLPNLPLSNFRANNQSVSSSSPQSDYPSLSAFSQSDTAIAVRAAVTDSFNKLLTSARDMKLPSLPTQVIGKHTKFEPLNQNDSSEDAQSVENGYDSLNESTSSSCNFDQCDSYDAGSTINSSSGLIQNGSAAPISLTCTISTEIGNLYSQSVLNTNISKNGNNRINNVITSVSCKRCTVTFTWYRFGIYCTSCRTRLCVVCFGCYNAVIKCMKPDRKCYVCSATQKLNVLYAQHILPLLQEGTSCYYRSDTAVRNASGNNGRLLSWIQAEPKKVLWRSMEMRNGRPVYCGTIAASEIKHILARDASGKNSIILERESRGNIEIEFTNNEDWGTWNQCLTVWHHLFLVDASITFNENDPHLAKKIDNAKHNRLNELAARKEEREERKKKYLSTGMGMKYTAEAMMNR